MKKAEYVKLVLCGESSTQDYQNLVNSLSSVIMSSKFYRNQHVKNTQDETDSPTLIDLYHVFDSFELIKREEDKEIYKYKIIVVIAINIYFGATSLSTEIENILHRKGPISYEIVEGELSRNPV